MKVLLTGAGGFLGRIIRQTLTEHEVTTLGRGEDMDLRLDICSPLPDLNGYDMVVHAAGKAHMVPKDEEQSAAFMRVNLEGTRMLLDALARNGKAPGTLVFISTVAVYGKEEGLGITESNPLDAMTPYGVSKRLAEREVETWAKEHQVSALILRLPLVVGKGAPGNLGAMERHLRRGTYFRIGDGGARRSMVLGSDVAELIARAQGLSGTYHVTDGRHPSFRELDMHMASQLGSKVRAIPETMARAMAKIGDLIPGSPFDSYRLGKLSHSLTFDDARAVRELGWSPTPVLESRFLV
jgi:nucleoside-diphosphate-sugar epimerase